MAGFLKRASTALKLLWHINQLRQKIEALEVKNNILDERNNILETKNNVLENNYNQLNDQMIELSKLNQGNICSIPELLESDGLNQKKQFLDDGYMSFGSADLNQFYYQIANLFRGPTENMKLTERQFVPYFKQSNIKNLPVIDIGCGRGEFLDLLREAEIPSIGVDLNETSANRAMENGHKVIIGDAIPYLKKLNDGSIAGISMLQVVEHIEFHQMFNNIFLFAKKITKGGVLLMNTINPYCYRRLGNFHLDPSHINFTPPEIYKLIMEMAGFTNIKIVFSAPIQKYGWSGDLHTQYENFTVIGYRVGMKQGDL